MQLNIFHIDRKENRLSIWGAPMLEALKEFLSRRATYRVTISAMERQMSLDVFWNGDWNSITAELAKRRAPSRR